MSNSIFIQSLLNNEAFIDNSKLKYPIKKSTLINFIANIILVITGFRFAYMPDRLDGKMICYLYYVFHLPSIIAHLKTSSGKRSLICLEENQGKILDMYKTESNPIITTGKILGYSYVGENWHPKQNSVYCVKFLVGYDKLKTLLYHFYLPVNELTVTIENKIYDGLDKYKLILEPYGFKIFLEIKKRQ